MAINPLIDEKVVFAYEQIEVLLPCSPAAFTPIGRFSERLPFWPPAPMP